MGSKKDFAQDSACSPVSFKSSAEGGDVGGAPIGIKVGFGFVEEEKGGLVSVK
jgi:hypothetical protein